jgi:hypothetical protein
MPTLDEVLALLAAKDRKSATGNKWFDGTEWHYGTARNVGSFQGRAGSIRRNRKGATSRMPNGTRKYIDNQTAVIAYLTKP